MQHVSHIISKDDYEKALREGAESIITVAEQMGYGVYSAKVLEIGGKYWLTYWRGDSCD